MTTWHFLLIIILSVIAYLLATLTERLIGELRVHNGGLAKSRDSRRDTARPLYIETRAVDSYNDFDVPSYRPVIIFVAHITCVRPSSFEDRSMVEMRGGPMIVIGVPYAELVRLLRVPAQKAW